jgi:tetratricopeptide (TPR) repeat protein
LPNTNQQSIGEWHREAKRAINRHDHSGADRLCRRILEVSPDHADAHFLIAMTAVERLQVSRAIELINIAIALETGRAEYYAQLGRCLVMLARDHEAVNAADQALRLNPADALTLDTIGCVYTHTGNHEKALEPFRMAVRKKPDDPTFQFNLAASLRFSGHFDEAETAYQTAIQVSPRFYRAHLSLSTLRKQAPERNHIKRLENLVPGTAGNVDAQLHLHHALAKEYEDIGRYDRAFSSLEAAKKDVSEKVGYSIETDANLFGELRKNFTVDTPFDEQTGNPTREPIFVVGMPRTGTTLTDRILSSHSQVVSAGELPNFGACLKRAARSTSNKILDPETVCKAMTINFRDQGSNYLESARPAKGHARHFIDKMPLNYLYIGFLRLALPNSKIVCLRRNPLDTCLSNFRTLFDINHSYYHYSFDIMDTARYCLLFYRLMEHWCLLFPEKILEVQYEDIVADQEAESRRLVEFCGLEWEDGCLEFETNTASVATASSAQVREPIYGTAVERWKHYEKQLEPVREFFEAEGITVS